MIYAYGVTSRGKYHERHGTVCQDSHRIVKLSATAAVAAVADGLGSEEHSDVASKIAAEVSCAFCAERIQSGIPQEEILEIIRTSFEMALAGIEKAAEENGHEINQYDTTLSLAILIDDVLYYGHSGDSGIIALTNDGLYRKVTEQQRDSEGRVFPLFCTEKWEFAKYEYPVVSVLLATDGMYEIMFPVYIRKSEISIYVALAEYFMEPGKLNITEIGEEVVKERIGMFVEDIPEEQVNDDKTVVVLMNTDTEYSRQPEEYYKEPDWDTLRCEYEEAWRREAYPQLYGGDSNDGEKQ